MKAHITENSRFKTIEEVENLGQYEAETLYNYIYNYGAEKGYIENVQKPILLDFINSIYDLGKQENKPDIDR